jgi:hypothetical protein
MDGVKNQMFDTNEWQVNILDKSRFIKKVMNLS